MLFVLKVTNGRDISKLSAVGTKEKEVLLLPGAKFAVEDLSMLKSGPAGNKDVPATAWVVVRLGQVA